MFDFYLPLEQYFVKILLENRIQNWEAKIFWINIEHLSELEDKSLRKQMYNGLRVLASNDFLKVEYSRYNDRVFLYSETLKLYKFREQFLKNNYDQSMKSEKNIIINELGELKLQEKFLDELYFKYPELAPQYFKLKSKIALSRQYADVKLKTIKSLIDLVN